MKTGNSEPCIRINEEGFRTFWKGNLVTVAHRLPYSSISFCAFEHYKNVFLQLIMRAENGESNISTDMFIRLAGGGLAGITTASVTYPLDLVRTLLSAFRASSASIKDSVLVYWLDMFIDILILMLVCFADTPEDSTALVSLACGSLSGIASSTVTFPLDLVRRRMQLEGAGGRARVYKTGILGTFRQIIKAEGFRGIYRGILPEYLL
ncbi:putative mitochondrial carrier protein [Helianthus anomalus]